MDLYKFANGQVVDYNYIKNKLIQITPVRDNTFGATSYGFTIELDTTIIGVEFDDEILAKEQKDAFVMFLQSRN
jgi:hypothetical protein